MTSLTLARKFGDQLVRVKMVVMSENAFQQRFSLLCLTHFSAAKVLFEPRLGAECHLDRTDREIFRHSHCNSLSHERKDKRVRTIPVGGVSVDYFAQTPKEYDE